MLKKLRHKKTSKKIWYVIIAAVIVTFIFWGSGSMSSKQDSGFVGKIFGKSISSLEYKDSLNAVKNQAIMQFGENYSELQKYLNLESQAWDRLIMLYEARKKRITASDKEVMETIESYPFLQHKGRFNSKIYSEMLQYVFRTQPRAFEEETRQNIMLSKLYKQITQDIKLSDEEIKGEYVKLNKEISINYIASLPEEFKKDISPAEEEIKDYFSKNSLQFKQPLSFNIEYIVLENENKTKEVALRLKKAKDFASVAKEQGLEVKESGLFTQIDPIPGIGWSPQISSIIAKLKIGDFAPPIYTDKRYYILRLKERKEAFIPEFDKIKDKVKEALIKEKSSARALQRIEDCLKELQELYKESPKQVDFAKAAKESGLKSDATGLFKFGSYIEGIGASDDFWLASQKLGENEFSQIITMPSGLFIIKLKSALAIEEKKFESEKEEFSKKLLSQKKEEYFVKFLEDLKKRAQ